MILTIGYGNPLRGDDGVGWHVAQCMALENQDADVEIEVCHQLMPELAEPISRADLVIFIDAAADRPPGKIYCEPVEAAPLPPGAMSHHCTPASLLYNVEALYCTFPRAVMLSVGSASFGFTEELSPVAIEAVPLLVERVRELIAHEKARAVPVAH